MQYSLENYIISATAKLSKRIYLIFPGGVIKFDGFDWPQLHNIIVKCCTVPVEKEGKKVILVLSAIYYFHYIATLHSKISSPRNVA